MSATQPPRRILAYDRERVEDRMAEAVGLGPVGSISARKEEKSIHEPAARRAGPPLKSGVARLAARLLVAAGGG